MFYVLSFLLGAAIGSYVLVVVTRLGVAKIGRSRSKCLSCGEALRIPDLIPIFSYLFLGGKCRYCKVPYGVDAIIVEGGFGVIFMLLYHFILIGTDFLTGLLWLVYYTLVFITLGVIALYDLKHSYVPVFFLVLFLFLSLAMLGIRFVETPIPSVLLGPVVVALPFLLLWLITRGRGLGFGDVVLYAAVGAFFGIEQGLAVLLLSIWLGALTGIVVYFRRKKSGTSSTAIPFVPFIVLGFLIVLFTDTDIFSIASCFSQWYY